MKKAILLILVAALFASRNQKKDEDSLLLGVLPSEVATLPAVDTPTFNPGSGFYI